MYKPNDFAFGMGATPVLSGSELSGYGVTGASNPVAAYAPQTTAPANTNIFPNNGIPPLNGGALGFNMDTAQLALGGLKTIGSLWQAWEANKLAKEQFKFGKDFANVNLTNQIQSYNTTLEDRGRTRAFTESQSPTAAAAYIDKNRLAPRTI